MVIVFFISVFPINFFTVLNKIFVFNLKLVIIFSFGETRKKRPPASPAGNTIVVEVRLTFKKLLKGFEINFICHSIQILDEIFQNEF